MKTINKLFYLTVFAAVLIFINCSTDDETIPNGQGSAGRLDIWVGSSLYTGGTHVFREEDKDEILVIVENYFATATGKLSITVGGLNANSFSVSPAAIGPIAAGDFDWFTIAVDGAIEGDIAAITISGGNINTSIQVQYMDEAEVIEPLKKEDYFGTFTISNGQRTMIINETGFTYIFTQGTPLPTDVQSKILSWKEVTWTPGNVGNNTGFTAGTAYRVWEIECEAEEVRSQTKGTQIAQFFGLSHQDDTLNPGHVFTVWLLSASGGINVGFINWSPTRTIPWPLFLKQ